MLVQPAVSEQFKDKYRANYNPPLHIHCKGMTNSSFPILPGKVYKVREQHKISRHASLLTLEVLV